MEETNDLVHASRKDDKLVNGLMLVTYRPYIGYDLFKGYDWRLFVTQLGDNDGGPQAMFGLQTARPIFPRSLGSCRHTVGEGGNPDSAARVDGRLADDPSLSTGINSEGEFTLQLVHTKCQYY